ncbi:LXG domain-containing protein [Halobacillus salinus]|uniref:LXG domain-containing protein n=1 Tax=Halobacillus salinus TaxID=192814 RepID=A0A4Z0GZ25_9BACI|nr:LXG domain-containing protein [Halobacillus salinus]TGB03463.1 hypothetical protein E4663_00200 [Halobacillus salinus]
MKTYDGTALHGGIDKLVGQIEQQESQLEQLTQTIEQFANLDQFEGHGGEAMRNFYRDFHLPLLEYYKHVMINYDRKLDSLKQAAQKLESNTDGFIREDFLETEVTNSLADAKERTTTLVDEVNDTLSKVADIVTVTPVRDDLFHRHMMRTEEKLNETVEDLHEFDTTQTKELDSVEHDVQMMRRYIEEGKGMLTSGELALEEYSSGQLRGMESYQPLKSALFSKQAGSWGEMLTTPFDYVKEKMGAGDLTLAAYQSAKTFGALVLTRKIGVNYSPMKGRRYSPNQKPTLWQKIRKDYKFTLKMDDKWTSRTKHSSKVASFLKNVMESDPYKNPVARGFQKYMQTYDTPSQFYKNMAGFPKNMHTTTGDKTYQSIRKQMTRSVKDFPKEALNAKGFVKASKRIPIIGNGITVVSNLGEFSDPANDGKSIANKTGRALTGVAVDIGAISAGTQVGATIGSVGGPIGVVVGGAIGGLAGGLAASKFGGKVKDIGGKALDKAVDATVSGAKDLAERGEDALKAVAGWFN